MKKYQVIYADPPWKLRYLKELKSGIKAFDLPYPQMTDKQIINLPVSKLVADDAILFLWAIDSRIPIVSELMAAWGFSFKTVGFVWNKVRIDGHGVNANLGKYTRKSCEFCLIGTRGKSLAGFHTQNQYVPEAKRQHSQKPDCIRDFIVTMCGDLPRVELFARQKTRGWDVWGNEVESDLKLAA